MSLTAFLAFCILGFDFMIYALFQWIYGERRRAFARQIAARKRARKEQLYSLPEVTRMSALHVSRPSPVNLTSKRAASKSPTPIRQDVYVGRTA